ncbi:MAG TPA: tyrosine-type recombinase/integrase, partial [Oscillospiraceae bacterium]|nr:tyrosine-type recombinase/integrase [Oscillospiraceae bacterium]
MVKWLKTNFSGVRYREHPTRKHGIRFDRYLAIRYQKDGKRIEEGIGWTSERDPEDGEFWTEKKAALVLERLKSAARHGTEGAPTRLAEKREIERQRKEAEQKRLDEEKAERERLEKEAVTFGTFWKETYFPQCKTDKGERTCVNEEVIYRLHLAGTLENLPLSEISPFHIERIKKDMADKKMSARSIQYALQVMRQVFHRAKENKIYAGEPPTKAVKWPKLDNVKLRYLSIEEAEKLLAALAAKSKNLHDAALLSLHSGLRFGELAALTWSCVNWEAGTLAILNAKTGSRIAYLTEAAKVMLKAR